MSTLWRREASSRESGGRSTEELGDSSEVGFAGFFSEESHRIPPLSTTAREAMRWGASDRLTAAIATAVLVDFGIVTSHDHSCVIDRQRIRREKKKYRENCGQKEAQRLKEDVVEGIYFDGKEIETLEVIENDGVYRQLREKKEHIVLLSQPDGKFLTHVTPTGKAAEPTTKAIMAYLDENDLTEDLKVVGVDSTAVNTGPFGGIVKKIEDHKGEKVHWVVCDLHTNELGLRHLFQALDGPTTGNNSFKGPIGKILPKVENLVWNDKFSPISDVPEIPPVDNFFSDLSSDQKYLFLVLKSIQSGKIVPQLKTLKPGPISHSRWLTLACRLGRLYLSKHSFKGKIKENLRKLIFYTVTNYIPAWFFIKSHPHIANAADHTLFQVQRLLLLPKAITDIVSPYVKSWNAHPENLLVSLLSNDDPNLRAFAVRKIVNLRQGSDMGDKSVRKFVPPKLNINAKTLTELIDWDSTPIYESILTCDLKISDLQNLILSKLDLPPFPTHTQSVERVIRDLTEVCGKIAGHDERDNFLRARLESREEFPKAETKKDFAQLV